MRITAAQLNYTVGDFKGNFALIEQVVQSQAADSDMIVFSELSLSGYYPQDLIAYVGFLEHQALYLQRVIELSRTHKVSIVIGAITKNEDKGKPFHNSLLLIANGKIEYTYHKRLLPVYNIFDEARHFAPGKEVGFHKFQGQSLGFLICEDGWAGLDEFTYSVDPIKPLVDKRCDIIICINGSPSNIGKQQERLQHFSNIAKRCQCPLLFTNQVGGNDDIVFDGSSFLLNHEGGIIGQLKAFENDTGTFSINRKVIAIQNGFVKRMAMTQVELFYQQTMIGLRDYLRKTNFSQVVIGVSGGVDSAITIALSVKAIGAKNVTAIAMPTRYSSAHSLSDAEELCRVFGVKLYVCSIEEEFSLILKRFESTFETAPSSITEQNIQARIRGRILMEYANQTGALVLSTGNKSELSVGYTTLYGDMTGGYNLIGDLYKTDVYALSEYFNQCNPNTPIPKSILTKIPSAELKPDQKDSDSLPEYDLLDPLLKLYIEGDLLPTTELRAYQQIATKNVDVFNKVIRMVDSTEFKRRQAPPIVRVQRRAFGWGRRLPIAAHYPTFLQK